MAGYNQSRYHVGTDKWKYFSHGQNTLLWLTELAGFVASGTN